MSSARKTSGTVKAAKKTAAAKGKDKDYVETSRSKNVTSADTVKNNPASSGSSKRAPGGKTKGV